MRRFAYLVAVVCLTAVAVPSCNILNDIGNTECADDPGACAASQCPSGAGDGGNGGAGGGDDGAGGYIGAGGDSAVAAGAGGAPGAGMGAGAGDSSDVSVGAGMFRSVPQAARAPRHRHRHDKGNSAVWCLDPCDAQCSPFAASLGGFDASVFNFVTTIADDGTGPAGGWQQASATLTFNAPDATPPLFFTCTITVGMPLRAVAYPKIPPIAAANTSALVANDAWKYVRAVTPQPTPGIFCSDFLTAMRVIFKNEYSKLGARVTSP